MKGGRLDDGKVSSREGTVIAILDMNTVSVLSMDNS